MKNIHIEGFSDTNANGIYFFQGYQNGYPCYLSENNYICIFYPQYMPYTLDSGYFIIEMSKLFNSAPVYVPKYYSPDTDVLTATWFGYQSTDSGEQDASFAEIDYMSTSSSSSGSSTSQSSSSSSSSSSESSTSQSSSSSSSSSESLSSESRIIGNMIINDNFIINYSV